MTNWNIGVDLGATAFKCGLISPAWKIVARNHAPTRASQGPAQAADRIAENVRALQQQIPSGAKLNALGICSPGPVDHHTGIIVDPPNLGWRNVPFAQMLSERLGIPVSLEHDAKAAALGEYHFGAGRGAKALCLIIIGTGIGGAFIFDGKLHRGEQDAAGEIGHITVDMDGPICTCGAQGCVQSFASGLAIIHAYNFAARQNVESAESIVRAAQAGDGIAVRVFQRAGRALGAGIAAIAQTLDVSTFVLFGSVVKAGELLLAPAREAVPRYALKSISTRVRIVTSELENDAGILGAAWGAVSG